MSSLEEQFILMQQLASLQTQINGTASTSMQSADDTAIQPLHSLGTRPHYDWTPSDALSGIMELDVPLHTSPALPDSERKAIIDRTLQSLIWSIKVQLRFLQQNVL